MRITVPSPLVGAALAVAALATLPLSSPAATRPGIAASVASSPAVEAATRRIEAARERVGTAGLMPDPEVEAMISRVDAPHEEFPMWELGIRQPLPRRGELAASRQLATSAVTMTAAMRDTMAAEMAADVAAMLAESLSARERAALLERQAGRLERASAALETRAGTTTGALSGRLAIQASIASMRLMVERERRMAEDADSAALGMLGLPPGAPLPAFEAPDPTTVTADRSPAANAASARGAEARAMARMALADRSPMTAVGLRFEREEEAMGNVSTFGIAFMAELPIRSRVRSRAAAAAAVAEEAAARVDGSSVTYRLAADLARERRARAQLESARATRRDITARVAAEIDALSSGAGIASMDAGGAPPALMVVDLLERETNSLLAEAEAEADHRQALAVLWRHVTLPLP